MMLDYNFKTNPGVKDLPRPGIEPQSPSPPLGHSDLFGLENLSSQMNLLDIKMDC